MHWLLQIIGRTAFYTVTVTSGCYMCSNCTAALDLWYGYSKCHTNLPACFGGHYAIRTTDLRAQESLLFRWKMRKKGHGFLSYHRRIPVRYCLTYVRSGLRELAMPAQAPYSHGAIPPPFLIASIGRFHQRCWLIVVRIIVGHCHRYIYVVVLDFCVYYSSVISVTVETQ